MKKVLLIITLIGLSVAVKAQCSLGSFSVYTPSSVTTTSMTVSWSSSSGADYYRLQISTNGGSTFTNSGGTTTSTSKTVTGLVAGNTYVFRVYAYCDYTYYDPETGYPLPGISSKLSSNTRTTTTKPNAPLVSSAANVEATSFTARWFTTNGATAYELDVSTCSSFCNYVSGYNDKYISGGATTATSVTGLTPGVTYYYRVRARTTYQTSSNSGTTTIETLAATPNVTAASSVTQSGFQANWGTASGADDYRLYVSTNVGFTSHLSGYNGKVVSGTSEVLSGLSSGSTYYYRVKSANTSNSLSDYSSTQTVEVIPATPVANAGSNIGQTSFQANWSNVSGEDNYLLDVSEDSDFNSFLPGYSGYSLIGTNHIVSGLNAGTTYHYRVRSENDGGASPYSGTSTVLLIPGDPNGLSTSNVKQNAFDVSWSAVTGADQYELDVSQDSDFATYLAGYESKVLSVTNESVTGLLEGTTYYYRVRASNVSGVSGNSEAASVITVPGNPTVQSASAIGQAAFTANWTSMEGAGSYLLDVSEQSDFSTFLVGYEKKEVAANSETVGGLNAGETYYYRVLAKNNSGESGLSSTESVQLIPADPVNVVISNVSQNGMTISWDASFGADHYLLDIAEDAAFTKLIGGYDNAVINAPSTLVSGLDPGIEYFVRVSAVNSTGESGHSSVANTITIPADPTANVATNISQSGFTANWSPEAGVDEYLLDVSESSDFSTFLTGYEQKAITGINEALTGLNSGETYYYRVSAQNTSGVSGFSNTITIQLIAADPANVNISSVSQNDMTVSWDVSFGADHYLLDVSENALFTSYVTGYENAVVNGTSFNVSGLTGGTNYYVRVSAVNSTGESGHSSVSSTITIPADPTANVATNISQSGFTANWDPEAGVDEYLLDVSESSDFSTFLTGYEQKAITGINEVLTGLNSGETYYYRVFAQNTSGASGFSNTITIQLIAADPANVNITSVSQNDMTVSWDVSFGVDHYLLDVSENSLFTSYVTGYENAVVNGTSTNVSGLTGGTNYFVRVSAVNTSGESGHSGVESTITIPMDPVASAATNISQTGFTANWNTVVGEDQYLLDVSQSSDFSTYLPGYEQKQLTGVSEVLTGLNSGETYYYRVAAQNSAGQSGYSEVQEVLLIPSDPSGLSSMNISQAGFDLTWDEMTGAEQYHLDISPQSDFSSFVEGYENATITGTTHAVSGLSSGLTYYCRVSASNNTGESGHSSVEQVLLIPADPNALSPTDLNEVSFVANWESVTGASSYLVDVAEDNAFSTMLPGYHQKEVSGTSSLVEGLIAGNTYFYRVIAKNESGNSGYSGVISALLAPSVPENLQVSDIGQTSYHLSWDAVNGADHYFLDIATDELFTDLVSNYSNKQVNGTSESISGLSAGIQYFARVRSGNETATSTSSASTQTLLIPTEPSDLVASAITQAAFTIAWSDVTGSDGYLLDISTSSTFDVYVDGFEGATITSNSTTISNLTSGDTYYCRLKAYNESGQSGYSEVLEVLMIPDETGQPGISDITQTAATISWEEQLGTDVYLVDLALDDSFNELVLSDEPSSDTFMMLESLTPGENYFVRVRTQNQSGISDYSAVASFYTIPADPTLQVATEITQSGFIVSWEPVLGAEHYYLDVSRDETFNNLLEDYNHLLVNGTSQQVSGLNAGETYYVRVSSYNESGESGTSATIETILIPANPTISAASAIAQTSFVLSWQEVTGREHFNLEVSLSSTFDELLPAYNGIAIDGISTTVSGLEPGQTYFARLSSENATGVSGYSEVETILLVPANPEVLEETNTTQTAFVANWAEVTGAEQYLLEVSGSSAFDSYVAGYENKVVTSTTSLVSNLDPGATYYYRVSAQNSTGESGHSDGVEVKLIPANPGVQTFSSISQTSYHITWQEIHGAASYLVDVATDEEFGAMVDQNVSTSTPELTVKELQPGVTYYSRIRAQNETGISGYSAGASVILVPADPTGAMGSAITQTEFTAGWEAVTGVDSYLFDVSQLADFSSFLPDYESMVITGEQVTVSDLDPGETYYFRVRARNANGVSNHSQVEEILLIPGEPVGLSANNYAYESFNIEWNQVTGASHYEVDVATDQLFDEVLSDYSQLTVSENQLLIKNLAVGTQYFIRVKAVNTSGSSQYVTINTETLPEIPSGISKVEVDHESIEISWNMAAGAEDYELEVATDANFENFLDGYPKLTGKTQNAFLLGLQPNTVYRVRMKSVNAAGLKSDYSITHQFKTADVDGTITRPEITNVNVNGAELSFTASSDNGNLQSLQLFHKKLSESEFKGPVEISAGTNNQFEIPIKEEWKDVFGWEYKIVVTDVVNEVIEFEDIDLTDPLDQIVDIQSFGKGQENYQMISIPYELEGQDDINDIMVRLMQGHDKNRWRFLRYERGKNIDIEEGVGSLPFQRGKSYWFISKEPVEFNLGDGKAYDKALVKEPFRLKLDRGYNQISNPMPFDISWQELLDHNGNPDGVGNYLIYNSEHKSLQQSDAFNPYEGGFVYADESLTLEIPISMALDEEISAGRSDKTGSRTAEASKGWKLPLVLKQGDLTNTLVAIGMSSDATNRKDRFDLVTPPHLATYINMSTTVDGLKLSQDVVNLQDEYQWDFSIDHNQKKDVLLEWNSHVIQEMEAEMYMLLPERRQLINMKLQDKVVLPASANQVSIYFSKYPVDVLNEVSSISFNDAYPNPSNKEVNIPFDFAFQQGQASAQLTIHNQFGQVVHQSLNSHWASGIKAFRWNGLNSEGSVVPSGIYYFTVNYTSNGQLRHHKGKIIIQH